MQNFKKILSYAVGRLQVHNSILCRWDYVLGLLIFYESLALRMTKQDVNHVSSYRG